MNTNILLAKSPDFELVNRIISFELAPKSGDFGEQGSRQCKMELYKSADRRF